MCTEVESNGLKLRETYERIHYIYIIAFYTRSLSVTTKAKRPEMWMTDVAHKSHIN